MKQDQRLCQLSGESYAILDEAGGPHPFFEEGYTLVPQEDGGPDLIQLTLVTPEEEWDPAGNYTYFLSAETAGGELIQTAEAAFRTVCGNYTDMTDLEDPERSVRYI